MLTEFEKPTLDNYSKSIQKICMYLVVSILLIALFIISPLKNYYVVSTIGKIVCILLLAFALYQNIILSTGDNQQVKANQVYSYILSLFIFVLILSILRKFFIKSTPVPVII